MDVIFDIDGTLANLDHRLHFVRSKPKNWKAFNKTMHKDTPIVPVVLALKAFKEAGHRIIISSGRDGLFEDVTVDWLKEHDIWQHVDAFYIRPPKDNRPDFEVKEEMLGQMIKDGFNPTIVFDDRPQVVDMWRKHGLFVFDCNQTRAVF